MGPNQQRYTRTLLYGEVLRILDLKSTELRHETVANLILLMDNVVTYFGPKQCLSKQKRYISLQNGETPQDHHKALCRIGSRYQFKDGTDATPV